MCISTCCWEETGSVGGRGGGGGTGRSFVSARAYTAIWAFSLASSLSRADILSIVTGGRETIQAMMVEFLGSHTQMKLSYTALGVLQTKQYTTELYMYAG